MVHINILEKILYFLQAKMETPLTFGWYHILWICLTLIAIIILYFNRKKYSERQLKIVLGTYGIITLVLELAKQLIWSFNYDPVSMTITWDYQWYAAPFQLCTTPMYIAIICLFLNKNKLRDSLLSYVAYFTILGSIATIIMPDSCFCSDVLVNIHTMYLHCGSLVVSVYLLFTKEIDINLKNLLSGFVIFLILATIANILNISFYNFGIIGNETFNMFYISPYFISVLPIYDVIQETVPYFVYLLLYIISIYLGGSVIFIISYCISLIQPNKKIH